MILTIHQYVCNNICVKYPYVVGLNLCQYLSETDECRLKDTISGWQ